MKVDDPRVTGQIGLSDYVRRTRQNVQMGVYDYKYAVVDLCGEIRHRLRWNRRK